MRDRFDVFLEALKKNIEGHTNPYRAIKEAIAAVEAEDIKREKIENQALEDIHYSDRYGSSE